MILLFKEGKIQRYIGEVTAYIQEYYVRPEPISGPELQQGKNDERKSQKQSDASEPHIKYSARGSVQSKETGVRYSMRDTYDADALSGIMSAYSCDADSVNLSAWLEQNMNQTFVDYLSRYIRKRGMKDSQVYKRGHLDRRLFSKMMSDRNYKPSKDTAIAVAIGLQLSLMETQELLSRAGYTLSHSSKRDIIIEYFIREGHYSIMDINEVLDRLDEKIIGR